MRFEMLELALELTLSLVHKVRFYPDFSCGELTKSVSSAGRVASRSGPTQNCHVDLATLHTYRSASRRDEGADAERFVQASDKPSSGFASGGFERGSESEKIKPSLVSGIVIYQCGREMAFGFFNETFDLEVAWESPHDWKR